MLLQDNLVVSSTACFMSDYSVCLTTCTASTMQCAGLFTRGSDTGTGRLQTKYSDTISDWYIGGEKIVLTERWCVD